MTTARARRAAALAMAIGLPAALGGCAVASATAGAAISVTGAVVATGVSLTGKAIGAGIDAASSSSDDGSGIVVRERIRPAAPAAPCAGDDAGPSGCR